MNVDKDLQQKIHDANITVHRSEAEYYELIHPEVYGRQEQRRIISTLSRVDKLIADNQRRALDFGAGTGNLTGKLLNMGYTVTSVDISSEMCAILRKRYRSYLEARKLAVVNSSRENLKFKKGEFDLITCYSVLHHMPDYEGALRKLSGFLKKGGAMYIDHEASNYYWETETNSLRYFVKFIYYHSNPAFNSLYFILIGLNVPRIDYTLSDYWHKKEHALDHDVIERVFKEEDFQFSQRTDHYVKASWITNPFFFLYKKLCKPEMSCWIAKK